MSLPFLSFFERVSDLLLRISRSTQLHQDFEILFPSNGKLQDLASNYLAVVVDISIKIIHYAKKSTLSQLASSVLSTFDSTFAPYESQLKDIGHQI